LADLAVILQHIVLSPALFGFMKHLLLSALFGLLFLGFAQAQNYQDTTFTDPVFLLYPDDFVTFENCRFIGIDGDAIYMEGAGVLISNCTFENVQGSAVVANGSEVYMVDDTLRNLYGGVYGFRSAMVALGCVVNGIVDEAFEFDECVVTEVRDCSIYDVLSGVTVYGSPDFEECYVVNTSIQRVHGSHAVGIFNVELLTIEGCVIDSCYVYGIHLSGNGGAAYSSQEAVKLQGNTISRTDLWGILTNNVNNVVFRGNDVSYPGFFGGTLNEGEGCIHWNGINGRFEGNHLHHALDNGCGEGNCRGLGLSLGTPALVTKNLIHDCVGHGILYRAASDVDTVALQIFNNIIYDVAGHPIFFDGNEAAPLLREPAATSIRNNTLHSAQSAPLAICCNENPIAAEGNILIFEAQADTAQYVLLSANATLFQNLNLKAPGDLDFVNFSGRDFHLASENSPAHNLLPLDFGLPNDDFDGDLRLGLRDAGADELALEEVICGCNNCPNGIPDLFFGDFTFAVIAAGLNDLSDPFQGVCGVRVSFEHEYIGDVRMELYSPAGQKVELVGPNGFWGSTESTTWNVGFVPCGFPSSPDPGFSATWNSNQNWGEAGAYTGTYYPSIGCLEMFDQGTVTGEWTLRVFDNQANDIGTVLGFEVMFCNMEAVTCFVCDEAPSALFTPNLVGSWSVVLNNQTTGSASHYEVDYGDGQSESGTFFSFFHEYANAGSYQIRLIATNDCGADTMYQTIPITGALPSAFVFGTPLAGCTPLEVQTEIISSDHVDTWQWLFPGGIPDESFEMEPSVVYNTPGNYIATLIIGNEVGVQTYTNIFSVEVLQGLSNPSFEFQVLGNSIICTNTTQNANEFHWTLNGGSPEGTNVSPYTFDVDSSGTYTVSLSVSDPCDTVVLTDQASVIIVGTKDLLRADWACRIAPNPNAGQFRLNLESTENLDAGILVLNALGVAVFTQKIAIVAGKNGYDLDLGQLPAGGYQLQIESEKGRALLRVIIVD
jgi:PKD repeat protein